MWGLYREQALFDKQLKQAASASSRMLAVAGPHPGVELRANLKSISNRCHLFEVAFVWEMTHETINLPMGCLFGGVPKNEVGALRQGAEAGGLAPQPPHLNASSLIRTTHPPRITSCVRQGAEAGCLDNEDEKEHGGEEG